MVCAFKMLHNGCADVALAQPDHVRHKPSAEIPDHLDGLADGDLLEIRQFTEYVVVPKEFLLLLGLQPVFHKGKERLHIDVVRSDLRSSPGFLEFVHQRFIEFLRFLPKIIEPEDKFLMVLVPLNDHV